MYNHGRTPAYAKATAGRRTTLTNVRADLEMRKRRCACGEAVRLPEAEGRAPKGEAARRVSVLVCGLTKGLQRTGVEEEGLESHERDAVSVGPWLFVGVSSHDDLPEVVADMA